MFEVRCSAKDGHDLVQPTWTVDSVDLFAIRETTAAWGGNLAKNRAKVEAAFLMYFPRVWQTFHHI